MQYLYDKSVTVKRYTSTLGEYNRPVKELKPVGTYMCHTSENSTSTTQLEPQKVSVTELALYTDPEADIRKGDVLYIYELDEYDKPVQSTELKAVADKPYKKRTQLKVRLLTNEEV